MWEKVVQLEEDVQSCKEGPFPFMSVFNSVSTHCDSQLMSAPRSTMPISSSSNVEALPSA